jgi:hypothetical protein
MTILKKTTIFALLLGVISLSSCINIFEDLTIKKDGSGHYRMKIDMAKVKEMMAMIKAMTPDTAAVGGEADQMGQIGTAFVAMADLVKNMRGISNVSAINDTADYFFGYEFDFVDVDALNRAVKKIASESAGDAGKSTPDEIFKYKKGKFERINFGGGMMDEIQKSLGGGGDGSEMDQAKVMLADMTTTTTYHFPDQDVKKQNHNLGQISADKHTIVVESKPFAEGVDLKKLTSAIAVKLK